jgi:hypothetical protein
MQLLSQLFRSYLPCNPCQHAAKPHQNIKLMMTPETSRAADGHTTRWEDPR